MNAKTLTSLEEYRPSAAASKTSVAEFIDGQLKMSDKTMRQIAVEEVGWPTPNMLSMIRHGTAKLPISKVARLARSLGVGQMFLLDKTMREYDPETWGAIMAIIGPRLEAPDVTPQEMEVVEVVRASHLSGTTLTKAQKTKLAKFIEEHL